MNVKTILVVAITAAIVAFFAYDSKNTIPKGAKAIKPFDVKKYLGNWYEIARMDFPYEKNWVNVSYNYTLLPDETIKMDYKGFDAISKKPTHFDGIAKFVNSTQEAQLKISFFGPYYTGYNVVAIDDEYKYALVVGRDLKYMWILSREKTMPEHIKASYLDKAKAIGYDVSKLIWVAQD